MKNPFLLPLLAMLGWTAGASGAPESRPAADAYLARPGDRPR